MLSKYSMLLELGAIILMATSSTAIADDSINFFDGGIDYWSKPKSLQKIEAPKTSTPKSDSKLPDENASSTQGFEWKKYMDPKHKEFFKEGDYTPPETFMEVVRNPTDQNIKMWFAYIDKKNELANRLQSRVREYMQKANPALTAESKQILNTRVAAVPKADPDSKRFRFRMYFDSHCPHCKRMMKTMEELQLRGFFVEGRQVDDDPKGIAGLTFPTARATPGEIAKKEIQSVPVLLIGDLKKKSVYRLSGYQSLQSVFNAIAQEVN